MPVPFNPFNPLHYMGMFRSSAVVPRETHAPGSAITVKAQASDTGFTVEQGKNSITLRGTARGPEPARDMFGAGVGDYARGVSFSLDVDTAPTTDVFGRTNYAEKNSRLHNVMTRKGWSAEEVAQRLADKVNAPGGAHRAQLTVAADGAATLTFTRR